MSVRTFTLQSDELGGNFGKSHVSKECGGQNQSPHLYWNNPPEGTRSFTLVMHDPDAPTESGFWHWAVFNIPAGTTELKSEAGNPKKDLLPAPAFMGEADTGIKAYSGPCPPEGDFPHRYITTIFAVDKEELDIEDNTPLAKAVFNIVTEHEIARASLISYYQVEKD